MNSSFYFVRGARQKKVRAWQVEDQLGSFGTQRRLGEWIGDFLWSISFLKMATFAATPFID